MSHKNFETAVIDFGQSIGLLVRRARAAGASDDLSWAETATLKRLAKDGSATTADLARAEGMRPQSMRTILATLERRGMIERKPHLTDGRQVNIRLTAKGTAVSKSAGEAKRTWFAQAIANLNDEEQKTLFAAGKVIKRLVKHDAE